MQVDSSPLGDLRSDFEVDYGTNEEIELPENDLDQMKFILLHIVNDTESITKKEQLKSKWRLDYEMSDFFKNIESETSEKTLKMLY